MPTLEQLDTPYERRRVIEYGVDGNKVVRHWHDVQHIAGPLYKSKEEKNKYGEQEMDLYLFFEGGKDGLLYQPQTECVSVSQVRTIPGRRLRPLCLLHGHPAG